MYLVAKLWYSGKSSACTVSKLSSIWGVFGPRSLIEEDTACDVDRYAHVTNSNLAIDKSLVFK